MRIITPDRREGAVAHLCPLNIKAKTTSVSLNRLYDVIFVLADISNTKVDELKKISVSGKFLGDFNLSSDFKRFDFKGKTSLKNANVSIKGLNQQIKNLNITVNSDNGIFKIANGQGNLDSTPFYITGQINKNTDTDIKIQAPQVALNTVFSMAKTINLPKETKEQLAQMSSPSGYIGAGIILKGKLKSLKTNINVSLSNASIYHSSLKTRLNLHKGDIAIKEKDISLKNIGLLIGKSPIILNGNISNYADKKALLKITAKGNLYSVDLKKFIPNLPPEMASQTISYPLIFDIKGIPADLMVDSQVYISRTTPLPNLVIVNHKNFSKILNVNANIKQNILYLSNTGIYSGPSVNWSTNTAKNISGSPKIISIEGTISNLNSKNPILKISAIIPNELKINIPKPDNMSFGIQAKLNISNNVNNPIIIGRATASDITLPNNKTSIKSMDINATQSAIVASTNSLNTAGNLMSVKAVLSPQMSDTIIINSLDVSSPYIDADKLSQATSGNQSQTAATSPFIIKNGTLKADKIKSGTINVTNISTNFSLGKNNIAKITNISADALKGHHTGTATYNLSNSRVSFDLDSTGMSGEELAKNILNTPGQLSGKVNSSIKLSTIGATPEEMTSNSSGIITFNIADGQMGSLGRLDFFLNAANLAGLNLGRIVNTLQPKNAGKFDTIDGKISMNRGLANIEYISSRGKDMSIYLYGYANPLKNTGDITVLGRVSDNIVRVLGPIGKFSPDVMIGNIPKFGKFAQQLFNTYIEKSGTYPVSKIPQLTDSSAGSKIFVVKINGNLSSSKSVKKFKWITE